MSSDLVYFTCARCGHQQVVLVPSQRRAGAGPDLSASQLVRAMPCPRCQHRDAAIWRDWLEECVGQGCVLWLVVAALSSLPPLLWLGWPSALAIGATIGVVAGASATLHRYAAYERAVATRPRQLLERDRDAETLARMQRVGVVLEQTREGDWRQRWRGLGAPLGDVSATARGGVWAVGWASALQACPRGWEGGLSFEVELRAVWEHGDTQIAAGELAILAREEARWQRDDREAWSWYGLWGDEEQVWVVGDGGRVARRLQAGVWINEESDTERCLEGIGGDDDELWAVGAGVIVRREGERWRRCQGLPGGDALRLHAVIVHEGVAWAVGDAGVVLRHTGARWELCGDLEREVDWRALWTQGDHVCAGGGATVLCWDSDGVVSEEHRLALTSIEGGAVMPDGRMVVVGW